MIAALSPAPAPAPDKRCEVPRCRKSIPSSLVMCAAHWDMVPFHMRKQLNDARRDRKWNTFERVKNSAVRVVEETERNKR